MAKKSMGKRSIIGAVGGVLIGAAILLFTATMILNALKNSSSPGSTRIVPANTPAQNASAVANRAAWNESNATVDQLKTFLTVCTILLGILGIVLIGATIISAIGGGFGGGSEE
jgi:predicted cobalt transporter CbtA